MNTPSLNTPTINQLADRTNRAIDRAFKAATTAFEAQTAPVLRTLGSIEERVARQQGGTQ